MTPGQQREGNDREIFNRIHAVEERAIRNDERLANHIDHTEKRLDAIVQEIRQLVTQKIEDHKDFRTQIEKLNRRWMGMLIGVLLFLLGLFGTTAYYATKIGAALQKLGFTSW